MTCTACRDIGTQLPAFARHFYLPHSVHTGSVAKASSSPRAPRTFPSAAKWAVSGVEHSPPSSINIKNAWSYTSTFFYYSMDRCLMKYWDNITFTAMDCERFNIDRDTTKYFYNNKHQAVTTVCLSFRVTNIIASSSSSSYHH